MLMNVNYVSKDVNKSIFISYVKFSYSKCQKVGKYTSKTFSKNI